MTILAQKVAPGLLDRYLARTGFDSQMTDEPADQRPGNLFDVVEGDPGADGPFADEARDRSLHAFISRHRGIGLALGALAAGASVVRRRG